MTIFLALALAAAQLADPPAGHSIPDQPAPLTPAQKLVAVPVHGNVGSHVRAEEILAIAKKIDRHRGEAVIVFELASTEGSPAEMKRVCDAVKSMHARHRVIAWVSEPSDESFAIAFACEETYLTAPLEERSDGQPSAFPSKLDSPQAWQAAFGEYLAALEIDPNALPTRDRSFNAVASDRKELEKALNIAAKTTWLRDGEKIIAERTKLIDQANSDIPRHLQVLQPSCGGNIVTKYTGHIESANVLLRYWEECPELCRQHRVPDPVRLEAERESARKVLAQLKQLEREVRKRR